MSGGSFLWRGERTSDPARLTRVVKLPGTWPPPLPSAAANPTPWAATATANAAPAPPLVSFKFIILV